MARQTIETLEAVQADYILTGGASCAIAMLHDYERLFADEPEWQARAACPGRAGDRLHHLHGRGGAAGARRAGPARRAPFAPVTYHNFCQSANVLGIDDAPRRLIRDVLGLELRELPEGSVCCGFGGSTSVTLPGSGRAHPGAQAGRTCSRPARASLVTDNPGCIMHLRGGMDAQGLPMQVLHIAELVATHLPGVEARA